MHIYYLRRFFLYLVCKLTRTKKCLKLRTEIVQDYRNVLLIVHSIQIMKNTTDKACCYKVEQRVYNLDPFQQLKLPQKTRPGFDSDFRRTPFSPLGQSIVSELIYYPVSSVYRENMTIPCRPCGRSQVRDFLPIALTLKAIRTIIYIIIHVKSNIMCLITTFLIHGN